MLACGAISNSDIETGLRILDRLNFVLGHATQHSIRCVFIILLSRILVGRFFNDEDIRRFSESWISPCVSKMCRFIRASITKGAVNPYLRRPATKVCVLQRPNRALNEDDAPFGSAPQALHPLSREDRLHQSQPS